MFGMAAAPDALPGRMETVELWPVSQGEIDGEPDGFIDAVFTLGPDLRHESAVSRADYAARIVRGGVPEAVSRDDLRRRGRFFDAYVQALIDRDVRQLSEIQRRGELRKLVRVLAARAGTLIAAGSLESALGLSRPTIVRYLAAQILRAVRAAPPCRSVTGCGRYRSVRSGRSRPLPRLPSWSICHRLSPASVSS